MPDKRPGRPPEHPVDPDEGPGPAPAARGRAAGSRGARHRGDGRPHEGLRVGPWLASGEPDDDRPAPPPADAPGNGPSWTAPTVELRPPRFDPGPAGTAPRDATPPAIEAGPAGGIAAASADAEGTRGSRAAGGRSAGGREFAVPGLGSWRVPAWLSDHGWLFAAGAVALAVLCCSRGLISGPAPEWTSAAPPVTRPATAPPATAAPPTTVAPSATPRATRTAGRPARKPSPSRARPRPKPSPVLLGPGNEWELWIMLRRFCNEVHGLREAQLRSGMSPAEGNWECRDRRGGGVLIDMTAACRHTYGSGAFARFSDRNNALSWRCYRNR